VRNIEIVWCEHSRVIPCKYFVSTFIPYDSRYLIRGYASTSVKTSLNNPRSNTNLYLTSR